MGNTTNWLPCASSQASVPTCNGQQLIEHGVGGHDGVRPERGRHDQAGRAQRSDQAQEVDRWQPLARQPQGSRRQGQRHASNGPPVNQLRPRHRQRHVQGLHGPARDGHLDEVNLRGLSDAQVGPRPCKRTPPGFDHAVVGHHHDGQGNTHRAQHTQGVATAPDVAAQTAVLRRQARRLAFHRLRNGQGADIRSQRTPPRSRRRACNRDCGSTAGPPCSQSPGAAIAARPCPLQST